MANYRKANSDQEQVFWYNLTTNNQKAVCQLLDQNDKYQFILSKQGQTPLEMACLFSMGQVVDKLLALGADPSYHSDDYLSEPPLHAAIKGGMRKQSLGILKKLLVAGVDPNQVNGKKGRITPLMVLCDTSQLDIIEKVDTLIQAGADIQKTDICGMTALHYACGRSELIRYLVKKGLDVNCQDNEGMTPLQIAVQRGSAAGVRTLLANGADPSIKNKYGNSAWDYSKEEVSIQDSSQQCPVEKLLNEWKQRKFRSDLRAVAKQARAGVRASKSKVQNKPKM